MKLTKNLKRVLNTNYKNGYTLYQVLLEDNKFILYLGDKKYIIGELGDYEHPNRHEYIQQNIHSIHSGL